MTVPHHLRESHHPEPHDASLLEWISLIVQVGILAVLLDIARNIRQVSARTGVSFYLGGRGHAHFLAIHRDQAVLGGHHRPPAGVQVEIRYAIWVFRGGSWVLLKPCGQPGCTCGPPPTGPGEYEGQVIRKECTPR